MDEVENTAESNEGLNKRATFTYNGAEVGFVGLPFCDVFNIDKLLLDGLEIKVKVDLNNDAFVLMAHDLAGGKKDRWLQDAVFWKWRHELWVLS